MTACPPSKKARTTSYLIATNMAKKSTEQFVLVKIWSKYSAQEQLAQMLADELKGEHIQGYELETVKVKYKLIAIKEDGEDEELSEFDNEEQAEIAMEEARGDDDAYKYKIVKVIE